MPTLPDPHRPFPDAIDDSFMDAVEAAIDAEWIAENEYLDDPQERADNDDRIAEAARIAREQADAAVAEAERLERLAAELSTSAKIARGNIAVMDAVTKLF